MSRLVLRLGSLTRARVPAASRGGYKRWSSTASAASPGFRHGVIVGGTLAVAAGLYVYSNTTRLDVQVGRQGGLISYTEVQKHNTPGDCWVVIGDDVYDLTKFAAIHPGGAAVIHRAAGHDATAVFTPIHPPGTIEDRLDPRAFVGKVDPATLPARPVVAEQKTDSGERRIDLAEIVGLPDFEEAARRNLTEKAWAYISAGATDMHTLDLNRSSFNQILFRPRVLVDVTDVDTSTTFMGQPTSIPVFISPTGMSKLAHPAGEPGLAAAAGECGIIQMISTNSSAPLEKTVEAGRGPQFMQLYVDRQRPNSEALLRRVTDLGLKAVFVTVDCPAPGKREADERSRAAVEVASGISGGKIVTDSKGGGVGRTTGAYIDPALRWEDIRWLRKHTALPLGVKGIQCVEDAVRCADIGVDAIYLSNHGGRALDTSEPALYTLLELRRMRPDVFDKCEVYIDGGVRRGTDVVKALCLGAKGVGMGRPFLYSLTYGEEGVVHAIEIMRDEIETTLRLLGVNNLSELGPHLLNTRALDSLVAPAFEYGPKEQYLPKAFPPK